MKYITVCLFKNTNLPPQSTNFLYLKKAPNEAKFYTWLLKNLWPLLWSLQDQSASPIITLKKLSKKILNSIFCGNNFWGLHLLVLSPHPQPEAPQATTTNAGHRYQHLRDHAGAFRDELSGRIPDLLKSESAFSYIHSLRSTVLRVKTSL